MKAKMVKINKEFLKKAVKESKLTIVEFCEEIGKSDGFFYNALKRGTMTETSAKFMCKTHNIDYGKLIAVEKKELKNEPIATARDYDKEITTIVNALLVLDARQKKLIQQMTEALEILHSLTD